VTVDLRTRYLGLELRNPLVVSSSPLGADLDTLRRMEEAGAGAVVLPSLFEEQIEREAVEVHQRLESWTGLSAEAASYFPELDEYNTGPGAYLEHVAAAKAALSIPVIGSLNGSTNGGWTRYARLIEEAGADALELNVYSVEADTDTTSHDVEARTVALVRNVATSVTIPLAVKVSPFFSAFAHTARQLAHAGAAGLVLFNRFLQPDIDPETLAVVPSAHLSTRDDLRLALRWIAILRGRVHVSLSATGGVHEPEDVVRALLAGADVTQMASVLLERGPDWLATLAEGLADWLDEHEYTSVRELKGSMSQASCPDPAAFERAGYMLALTSFVPRPAPRAT
jgi:dihydroorotate dehydrogenase (fumarate)